MGAASRLPLSVGTSGLVSDLRFPFDDADPHIERFVRLSPRPFAFKDIELTRLEQTVREALECLRAFTGRLSEEQPELLDVFSLRPLSTTPVMLTIIREEEAPFRFIPEDEAED